MERWLQKSSFVVQFWYMTTLVKDTHQLVNFLQKKGYSKEQAEGFVEAVNEFELDDIAKSDQIKDLDIQIKSLDTKINFTLGLLTALCAGMFVLLLEKLVG